MASATYKGVRQHGDYSLWTPGMYPLEWWHDYYWKTVPEPRMGMKARDDWEKANALLAAKLKEVGLDVGNAYA